ncbi:acylphosphatase [Halobacillus salinus]|uniref:acylphosphatase n=1 Tax=Halobacillus salinus TaxID=192814 RepID=A0A4Z0H3W3_9BACI|nr:acylphosphatase [Halobacillus salinus]TGB04604.1 acylphosphatase [Halobacillus salinus]
MERRHIIVHGRVQGVGFRASVQQVAVRLEVNGWIKNKSDGTVELEAEGNSDQLDHLEQEIEKGPSPFAKVRHMDVSKKEPTQKENKFQVIH